MARREDAEQLLSKLLHAPVVKVTYDDYCRAVMLVRLSISAQQARKLIEQQSSAGVRSALETLRQVPDAAKRNNSVCMALAEYLRHEDVERLLS